MSSRIVHGCCGSRGKRHLIGCKKKKPPKLENGWPVTLEICQDYYERFGEKCLTPNQLALFRFLLEAVEKQQ